MSFEIGQRVIYSDLSPWETATVAGLKRDITQRDLETNGLDGTSIEDFDYLLQFDDDERPLPVQSDGMREYTPENIEKYLGEYVAPSDELLA